MDGSGGTASSSAMVSEDVSGSAVAMWLQSVVFIRNLLRFDGLKGCKSNIESHILEPDFGNKKNRKARICEIRCGSMSL